MMTNVDKKQKSRKELLSLRGSLHQDIGLKNRLINNFFAFLEEQKIRTIGLYYPIGTEIDLLTPFLEASKSKKLLFEVSLPRVIKKKEEMAFYFYDESVQLDLDAEHIKAPIFSHQVEPDLIVIPCVGYSPCMHRLGYGGGYFDRYLCSRTEKNIIKVGIAYEEQEVSPLLFENHDQKMDFIITQQKILSK